jgi:hypothetical protein
MRVFLNGVQQAVWGSRRTLPEQFIHCTEDKVSRESTRLQ